MHSPRLLNTGVNKPAEGGGSTSTAGRGFTVVRQNRGWERKRNEGDCERKRVGDNDRVLRRNYISIS